MAFRPKINSQITIGGRNYYFTEHPTAPGIPYGQSGKRATVYQVRNAQGDYFALKVFVAAFRKQEIDESARVLSTYAHLKGLQVCKRDVLNSTNNPVLVTAYPELNYAVLMPWVSGKTWYDVLAERHAFTKAQSISIARAFTNVLCEMEQAGMAHCDLSSPNVIINKFVVEGLPQVSLVDVEDMFGPGFKKPTVLPGGTSGYAHSTSKQGQWNSLSDRFSGAVLISEMLGWFDSSIRMASGGEQYFNQNEMQTNSTQFGLLYQSLFNNWGPDVAYLFKTAWESKSLSECPAFSTWNDALKNSETRAVATFRTHFGSTPISPTTPISGSPIQGGATRNLIIGANVDDLIEQAQKFETDGDYLSALNVYRSLSRKSNDPSIGTKVSNLENLLKSSSVPPIKSGFSKPVNVGSPIRQFPSPSPTPLVNTSSLDVAPQPTKNYPLWIGIVVGALCLLMSGIIIGGLLPDRGSPTPTLVVAFSATDTPLPSPVPTATNRRNTPTARPSSTPVAKNQSVTIQSDKISLRKGPDINHPLTNELFYRYGTTLNVLGYYGDWFYVKAPDGATGWVYQGWLNTSSLNLSAVKKIQNIPTVPAITKPTKKSKYP